MVIFINEWQCVHRIMLTFLCWEHSDNGAEGSFPTVIKSTHFDVKGRERWYCVIAENISCHNGWGYHCPGPGDCAHWSEGDDVTKAFSILQLLWDWLGVEHKTVVILKHIESNTPAAPHFRRTWVSYNIYCYNTAVSPQVVFKILHHIKQSWNKHSCLILKL